MQHSFFAAAAAYLPLSSVSNNAEYLSPMTSSLPKEDKSTKTDKDLIKVQAKEDVMLVDAATKRSIQNEVFRDGNYIKEVGVIGADAVANHNSTDSSSLTKASKFAFSSKGDLNVKCSNSNEYINGIAKVNKPATKIRFENEKSLKSNDLNPASKSNGSPKKIPNHKGDLTVKEEVKINFSSQDYTPNVDDCAASNYPLYEESENGYVKDFTLLQASELEGNYVKDIAMPEGNLSKNKRHNQISDLGYVTIEQLKNGNVL